MGLRSHGVVIGLSSLCRGLRCIEIGAHPMSLYSAVLILPADLRTAGDALSVAMGHANPGVSTYSVPLCSIGGGEPTHYACNPWVTAGFKAEIEAAQQGQWPENFTAEMIAL